MTTIIYSTTQQIPFLSLSTTNTFSAVNFNSTFPSNTIAVGVGFGNVLGGFGSSNVSLTVAGVAATEQTPTQMSSFSQGFFTVNISSVSAGDIVVSADTVVLMAAPYALSISVYALQGVSPTPSIIVSSANTTAGTNATISLNANVGIGDAVLAVGQAKGAVTLPTATWTGLTKNFDADNSETLNDSWTTASYVSVANESPRTFSVAYSTVGTIATALLAVFPSQTGMASMLIPDYVVLPARVVAY